MKTILILEDNEERISDFRKAANQLGNGWMQRAKSFGAGSMCSQPGPSFLC
jgi:hypothetical protein